MFDFILLDLDDTLYEYDPCHKAGLEAFKETLFQHKEISDTASVSLYSNARNTINTRLKGQASSHSRLLYAKEVCEALGEDPTELALLLEEAYWKAYFPKMKLRDHVEFFLKQAKAKGAKIGIITDLTTEVQLKKIKYLSINQYIDQIITSEEAGVEKPNPFIFELCLKKLNGIKSKAVMIGDSFDKDYLGAKNFGLEAYLLGKERSDVKCFQNFNEILHLTK